MNYSCIVSLNINHKTNLCEVIEIVKNEKPLFVFLQEIVQTTNELNSLLKNLGYKGETTLGQDSKPGVGYICKSDMEVETLVLQQGHLQLV